LSRVRRRIRETKAAAGEKINEDFNSAVEDLELEDLLDETRCKLERLNQQNQQPMTSAPSCVASFGTEIPFKELMPTDVDCHSNSDYVLWEKMFVAVEQLCIL
jgi:hypothetical protein